MFCYGKESVLIQTHKQAAGNGNRGLSRTQKRAAEESRGPKSQMQIVLLFDPSLENAQEKLEYDLPESARSCRDFSRSRRRAV